MPYREACAPTRAAVRPCPSCRLINPPSALRCDCGYVFATGEQSTPLELPRHRQQAAAANGAALAGLGILVVALFTAVAALKHGGYVWTGGIVVGVSMIGRAAMGPRRR